MDLGFDLPEGSPWLRQRDSYDIRAYQEKERSITSPCIRGVREEK